MSFVIDIPTDNPLFITRGDLGKGLEGNFSDPSSITKKSQVFSQSDPFKIKTTNPHTDRSKIERSDGEKKTLQTDAGDSYDGKIGYKSKFRFFKQMGHTCIELYDSPPFTDEVKKVKDIESLRAQFGFHYIGKIEFGAVMDITITLESENKDSIKSIQLQTSSDLSLDSLTNAINQYTREDSMGMVSFNSKVSLFGCVQKKNFVTVNELKNIFELIQVDASNLVPIRMEICPIQHKLIDSLGLLGFEHYKRKLVMIGENNCQFDQMIARLKQFQAMIDPIVGEEEQSSLVMDLFVKAPILIRRVTVMKNQSISFIKNTVEYIIGNSIPHSEEYVAEEMLVVKRFVGETLTVTDRGSWYGSSIDKVPVYYGKYCYTNGQTYNGFCLNGKKNGQGTLEYPAGNISHIKSIKGGTTEKLVQARDLIRWNEKNKSKMLASHVVKFDQYQGEPVIKFRRNIFSFFSVFDQLQNSISTDRDRYYFLLMGITGSGKTTMVEYLLNILTGQLDSPDNLRATDLESTGIGEKSMQCVSTIVTFCETLIVASDTRRIINEMINGIGSRPVLFLDNPWSQHRNNTIKSQSIDSEGVYGFDNTGVLPKKIEETTRRVVQFMVDRIRSNVPFATAEMKSLGAIRNQLMKNIPEIGKTIKLIGDNTKISDKLASQQNLEAYITQTKDLTMEEWVKDKGYALIDGVPHAKIMSGERWPDGGHATVCLGPECKTMVCHQGCSLAFTSQRHSSIFTGCRAFRDTLSKIKSQFVDNASDCLHCLECELNCSHQHHIHTEFKLEWFPNNEIVKAYYEIVKGSDSALKMANKLNQDNLDLQTKFTLQLGEIKKLEKQFHELSVLGDIKKYIESTIAVYRQQLENGGQVLEIRGLLEQLEAFLTILKDSPSIEANIQNQVREGKARYFHAWNVVKKIIALPYGLTPLSIKSSGGEKKLINDIVDEDASSETIPTRSFKQF
ncbi:hypothetical protein DFA_07705 [Cavenderia fasciculata]|uniref:Uncharacterized protein n=1 Tax=Cavenderia fasciculata TaxID=261658 RepID=F4Q2V1_CACFS|nr:uncharacterized protein DFA_07705 [Cavenderia fasciculata]EGG16727.1 hypothetical protein DFA_07705 [Cavenderia fasciculata]|eukprot:XP_004355201.1 hypothetical protein DFA_07705 [Cavenderia fasciculata]